MSRADIILSVYAAVGLIVFAGIFIYCRKDGSLSPNRKAVGAVAFSGNLAIFPLLFTGFPLLFAAVVLLLWPLALLGFLLCWLDGKAVSENDNHRDQNT